MRKLFTLLAAILCVATSLAANYSGTLPVLYINTENSTPITSKEDYLKATYYLDNLGIDGYKSFGSADNQLPLQIKGRGNYTFYGFDKKPYRLKLDSKAALLGMKKSKHFALLAHADDNLGFLRNTMGFELSRRMGLDFTPEQRPVEVVLNGDYVGLYFLTETIRVDSDRVKITEQADNDNDQKNATGGWLVEIDNYWDADQVTINEGNGELIRFTHKSPEKLSDVQRNYLINLVSAADRAIYAKDKSSTNWENIIDIDSLAAFYLIQEIMDNAESFHGSCYFHKDRGSDTKMIFGPVWDFGNSFHRGTDKFIHQDPPYGQTWIAEIAKFPRFQNRVKELWYKFLDNDYASLDKFADDFVKQITKAADADARRWPNYGNKDMEWAKGEFLRMLHAKADWLKSQWGESSAESVAADTGVKVSADGTVTFADNVTDIAAYDLSGKAAEVERISSTSASIKGQNGIYIVRLTTEKGVETAKVIIQR